MNNQNFKRFMRGSVLNDIFYHGTNLTFQSFSPSERGALGAGVYFCNTKETALMYGVNIIDVYVNVFNPWFITLDYESEMAEAEDFDCPCIEAVLSLPNGRALIDEAKATDGKFGQDLQDILISMGYDGIVGEYSDGSNEVVVFYPEKIKSASKNNGKFNLSTQNIYR